MLLLALACKPTPDLGPPSPATFQGPLPPVAHMIAGLDGTAGLVWTTAVNTNGSPVAGDDSSVFVEGATRPVLLDDFGYGAVSTGVGRHEVTLGSQVLSVSGYGVDWPGLGGLDRGAPAPTNTEGEALSAGRGVLLRSGNTVWWTSPDAPTHPVLTADGPILSMHAAHLDGDGILDAAAATATTVYLLRGRELGGMTDVGRITAPNRPLVDFALGDADNDDIADVMLVWREVTGDLLDVWRGDGRLGFTAGPARRLLNTAVSVTGAHIDSQGAAVAVSHDQLGFRLYYANGEVFQPTGPILQVSLPENTGAWAPGDLDGDGLEELVFSAPDIPGTPRQITMIELGPDPNITSLDRDTAGHFSFHDYDDNGRVDALLAEDDGRIVAVTHDGEGLLTTQLNQTSGGPVAFLPESDRILMAEEDRWLWMTFTDQGDDFLDAFNRRLDTVGVTLRNGHYSLTELDGDTVPELVAARFGGLTTELLVRSLGDNVVSRGRLRLSDQPQVLVDLAVCGTTAYALLPGSLHAVDLSDPDHLSNLGMATVIGTRVACGDHPAGPVAVLTSDELVHFDPALNVVHTETTTAENLWLDALGVLTCAQPACDIARIVLPEGQAEIISTPSEATYNGGRILGRGFLTLADVDQNGFEDLVFHDHGTLTVHRRTAQGFGTPEIHHTQLVLEGPLSFWDHDGDGSNDAWGADLDNDRVRITPSLAGLPPSPHHTGDTGDTGDTAPPTGDTGAPDTADSDTPTGDTASP